MDTAAVDFPALLNATLVALAITAALGFAHRAENSRRDWIIAAALAVFLVAVGLVDLLREDPRETHIATVFFGAALPVFGAMGMIRSTRRIRAGFRWPIVFATTFVLLFGGLLIGAALLPRLLPF